MSLMNGTRELHRAYSRASAIGSLLLSVLLAACSGTTGPAGPAGSAGATGSQGPPASGAALNISAATTITGTITSVAISGPPIVKFELNDQTGAPVQGLPASDLGFAIAQLLPGQNGTSSQWNS